MKCIFLSSLLTFFFIYCNAQSDTLYILFEEKLTNNYVEVGKHRDDPNPNLHYPFDGGRHYWIKEETVAFLFWSYTPEWMDHQFFYEIVDKSILNKKDFKDHEWFDNSSYTDIVNYFSGKDKVIMLLDEKEMKNDSAYLVRVYPSFFTEE